MTVSRLDDARTAPVGGRFDEVEQHTVHNDGIDIAYFVQGDPNAPVLLLVHGWPDSHHLWDGVIPHLRDRFRCVAIDSRGAGGTTNPKSYKDFALAELARDLVAVADRVSPDAPVHLLGHDWGSVAAWEAVCDPGTSGRFASFTSVSGPCASHMTYAVRSRLARPSPRNLGLAAAQIGSLFYMLGSMTPGLPNILLKLTMTEQRWRMGLSLAEGAPARQIHLGPTFRNDLTRTLRIYRANALQAVVSPKERYTDVPVQVIVGTRDPAVRQSSYDDEPRWNKRTWRRVVDGGHWLPFSHPQLLAGATIELADHVEGKPASRTLRRAEMGQDMRPFEHQLVVVTGGGSGIGRETALEFARQGAEIVVSDINLDTAKETVALVERAGGIAHGYRLDVSDPSDVERHASVVLAEHGVPDVLVNNAGVGAAGDFLATPREEFDRVLGINLFGVVNVARVFAAAMADRKLGGHIVNLSSMAAYSPQPDMGAYATSKAAVFMFSDCLRAELAKHDIGVTTICPGIVHTNIITNTKISGVSADEEARMQEVGDRAYAMRRYGPEKVAKQIVTAVRRRREVVPVTPESKAQYLFNRAAPWVVRRAARSGGMTDLMDKLPARFMR
ncbi:peptidase S33 family protein [Gordonia hirsuta DSM 44140 = NBRC 16056]|uniref:Peptidase S33 family protein n=1 Tax=Gordonia hirsuta DSM 44140 = NBRC 16056 TaxID=1121927 RepID=L7LDH0_9ACTN|nr:SDR family oxidoreductase [Gordonia hirsuta]GAC58107.1 peptidase S33 family protein [Gordonia hirsuta DSM 44140 = NBRC 16056]